MDNRNYTVCCDIRIDNTHITFDVGVRCVPDVVGDILYVMKAYAYNLVVENDPRGQDDYKVIRNTGCPTQKQIKFIWDIENALNVRFTGSTEQDAQRWLSKYVPIYKSLLEAEFEATHDTNDAGDRV